MSAVLGAVRCEGVGYEFPAGFQGRGGGVVECHWAGLRCPEDGEAAA